MVTTVGTRVDAFTAEVIRSAVVSITDEMKRNLQRTAYSPIIYESEDFTVALLDAEGNTISVGLGLPMFIRGLSEAIKAKIEHWGQDGIEPGDVLLTNHPSIMGSHLNHMIFTVPIFHDGELVAFSSSMAHWPDVGGVLGGVTRDLYSEGLQIPFLKVYRRGVADADAIGLIRSNCRLPERAMGDMRAQLASIQTGERRLLSLLDKYGNDAFVHSIRMLFDQSERLARAAVQEIPDGVYEAESFMDDDGVAVGKHIQIGVRVEVRGDEMTIDLSGVGPQVTGYFNSGPTAGRSAAEVAFKFLTSPLLLPINYGSFRPVKIVLPPGRVISAVGPAAVRWWMAIPMTVVGTIIKAVAPGCPERVMAGEHASLSVAGANNFIDPLTGQFYLSRGGGVGGSGGGWGAVHDADGQCATICLNDGDTHNHPVEAGEAKTPVFCVRRSLRPDSGGPGRWRGGLGTITEVEVQVPAMYQAQIERTQCAPWGLSGGQDGLANRIGLAWKDRPIQRFPSGKATGIRLEPGDAYLIEMGGGGGFGDPLDREVWRVLSDVRSGYVSQESAQQEYGVVIHSPGPRQYLVDEAATVELRDRLRRLRPNRGSMG